MEEGSGGRKNPYFRVSIDGKGSYTLAGKLSNDLAKTHTDISSNSLEQITDLVNSILGK